MKHPFQIALPYNDDMECYEVVVSVGKVSSEEEAKKIAKLIIDFLEAKVQ